MAAYVIAYGDEIPVECKRCTQCHIVKDLNNFFSIGKKEYYVCKLCFEKNRNETRYASGKKLSIHLIKTEKKCSVCNKLKPVENFHFYLKTMEYVSRCAQCISTIRKERTKKDRRTDSHYYLKWIMMTLKARSRKLNVPFNLDVQDIIIPEYCPALGVKLIRGKNRPENNSPSVDRIIPEKGYVKGNIVVVSMLANQIKTNATWQQIRAVADFYEKLEQNKVGEI